MIYVVKPGDCMASIAKKKKKKKTDKKHLFTKKGVRTCHLKMTPSKTAVYFMAAKFDTDSDAR